MRLTMMVLFIGLYVSLCAQDSSDTIYLDINTTAHLIFESEAVNDDLGSGKYFDDELQEWVQDVNVERVGNRVKVTPAIEDFVDTNLFIETKKGYYNFILIYRFPKKHIFPIGIDQAVSLKKNSSISTGGDSGAVPEVFTSDEEMYRLCYNAATREGRVITGDESTSIRMWIDGVYVNGISDKLFVTLSIYNRKNIVYDWGYTGFFVRAKGNKGIKNEIVQEEQLVPVYVYNDKTLQVESDKIVKRVYVFDKFTIEKKKVLSVELWENEGERKVILELDSKDILDAERI